MATWLNDPYFVTLFNPIETVWSVIGSGSLSAVDGEGDLFTPAGSYTSGTPIALMRCTFWYGLAGNGVAPGVADGSVTKLELLLGTDPANPVWTRILKDGVFPTPAPTLVWEGYVSGGGMDLAGLVSMADWRNQVQVDFYPLISDLYIESPPGGASLPETLFDQVAFQITYPDRVDVIRHRQRSDDLLSGPPRHRQLTSRQSSVRHRSYL